MTATSRWAILVLAAYWISVPASSREGDPAAQRCAGADPRIARYVQSSRQCLSCHDGVVASNRLPDETGRYALGREGNHPVMISYAEAYFRNPGAYVAPARLDRRLKLEEGQIHCTTCHATTSTERFQLVITDRGSALCLSCHRM